MADAPPKLDALRLLLATAQELSRELSDDPVIGRLLRAVSTLPPDDREVLTTAIERGAAWRRVNEAVSAATGVQLRVNPRPLLFVRVLQPAPDPDPATLMPEADDVMVGVLRVMRLAPMLRMPEARALWRPAVVEALDVLEPAERTQCLRFVEELLEVLAAALADEPPPES